jgi:hypothetical protein
MRYLILALLLAGCMPPAHPKPPEIDVPAPDVIDDDSPLRVLIVYERDDVRKLPQDQRDIIDGPAFRAWLKEHDADWRIWDQHVDASSAADPFWRDALKQPRTGVPWLYASKGSDAISGPLPSNVELSTKAVEGVR